MEGKLSSSAFKINSVITLEIKDAFDEVQIINSLRKPRIPPGTYFWAMIVFMVTCVAAGIITRRDCIIGKDHRSLYGPYKIPQRQLLCQLGSGEQNVSFVCPKGHHFNLVIGVPKGSADSDAQISGKLVLKAGTNLVGGVIFDSKKSTKANWLEKQNLAAYVITLPVDGPPTQLDQQLEDGSSIELHVEAKVSAGSAASLWLTYLTRPADLKK